MPEGFPGDFRCPDDPRRVYRYWVYRYWAYRYWAYLYWVASRDRLCRDAAWQVESLRRPNQGVLWLGEWQGYRSRGALPNHLTLASRWKVVSQLRYWDGWVPVAPPRRRWACWYWACWYWAYWYWAYWYWACWYWAYWYWAYWYWAYWYWAYWYWAYWYWAGPPSDSWRVSARPRHRHVTRHRHRHVRRHRHVHHGTMLHWS